jgi:hypothetical protein
MSSYFTPFHNLEWIFDHGILRNLVFHFNGKQFLFVNKSFYTPYTHHIRKTDCDMQSALRPCRAFSVIVQADGDRNYIVNDIRLKIWDSEPSIKRVAEFLSPTVKRPWRKATQSPPSRAEVKN